MSSHRIIFVSSVFDEIATGPARYAQILWQAFGEDPEFEFHVVAPSIRQAHPRLHSVTLERAGSAALYDELCRKALELAKGQERRTLLHGNAAHAMRLAVGYQGPWIVQVNDYETASFPRHALKTLRLSGPRRVMSLLWRRRQETRVLPASTRVVCNSDQTRNAVLHAYTDVNRDRALTIHKGVDLAEFNPSEPPLPDPLPELAGTFRLVFVGCDWMLKGLDLLLHAIHQLGENRSMRLSLAVAGEASDRRARRRILALCRELNLTRDVRFVGTLSRAQLAPLLHHSDLFVLPSRREALGVSILEAMAAGLPVIATRVGGIPEMIRSENHGILIEPDDPGLLAGAIARLWADEPLRRRLAIAGRRRAEDFSTTRMINRLRELYRSLLESMRAVSSSSAVLT